MQLFAIPRLDPGFEGIHLVWSWPETLPLSLDGYDLQRLDGRDQRWLEQCETIDGPVFRQLDANAEYAAPLGPLRLRRNAKLTQLVDASLYREASTGDHPIGFGPMTKDAVHASISATLAGPPVAAAVAEPEVLELIQELASIAERATVRANGSWALAIGLSAGKAVAVGWVSALQGGVIELTAPAMDTITVYSGPVQTIDICVFQRPLETNKLWADAPYVAKNVTLPIRECNPALATPAAEFAEAKSRLLDGETLAPADFERMAGTLRATAGDSTLGRSGERICLTRADSSESFEELPLVTQLSALALHPKARRVLGFGFADRRGLVAGNSYLYRLTGRFEAADLYDRIYDVHRLPAATVLPAAFSIRDLALRFQLPPAVVLEPAAPGDDLRAASRRGIRVESSGYDDTWLTPSLDQWSAVITLPAPVQDLVLEVAPGHSFSYAAGLPWLFGSAVAVPLPAGPRAVLHFSTPILELRLAGQGILFAVRIPSGVTGEVELHAYAGPVTFAAKPLPVAPTVLSVSNLQQPPVTLSGPIDESTPVPPRPPLGFRLDWLPAPSSGIGIWPQDQDAGPPLDALAYAIDHRRVDLPATYGAWEQIVADDNLTLGSRDMTAPEVRLEYGCDLDELFPAVRRRSAGSGFALHVSDVFGTEDPTTGARRPPQPAGSYHQYEIRAVDAVGRVSAVATLSNVARLEKHIAPPLPVGPQPPPPLDAKGHLTQPSGARARAIVRGAPGLTAADVALLGTHQNAILFLWGWRQEERDLDPSTAEFRVYLSRPLDVIDANITAVVSFGTNWSMSMTTNLPLVAGELTGLWVTSNAYPFQVLSNTAGTSCTVVVAGSLLHPGRQPVPGAVTLGRGIKPGHQRPLGWDNRVAIYPLTAAENYQHVFYDVLGLSEAQPRDSVWVGVSAADQEPYVADERTTGLNAGRPGNESGIVTCQVAARYRGRPVFSLAPPLGDVPELVTDEPTGRQVLVDLDLNALLAGALPAGSPVALLRCAADHVTSRVSVVAGEVVFTHPDGTTQTIGFPNPGDHTAVLDSLNSDDPQRIANRYLLHILSSSTNPLELFERETGDLDVMGVASDRLAPKPGRYFYAVQAADSLGSVSEGGAVLPVIVRVPSVAGAAKPAKRALGTTDTSATLTVAVGPDWETTGLLLFLAVTPAGVAPPVQGEAELLRVPNRRDLYPNDGLRLLTTDGELRAPVMVKQLSDTDVTTEPDGTRVAALTVAAAKGSWITMWCYALTRDSVPSFVCGPFSSGVGA